MSPVRTSAIDPVRPMPDVSLAFTREESTGRYLDSIRTMKPSRSSSRISWLRGARLMAGHHRRAGAERIRPAPIGVLMERTERAEERRT
jgi:hypothetical protein